jgi:3-methyladenine DNA glycosylase Tag
LCGDSRVIRNRSKIQAIVANARKLMELESEHGSVDAWLDGDDSTDAVAGAFKYVGPSGAVVYLSLVGREETCATHGA